MYTSTRTDVRFSLLASTSISQGLTPLPASGNQVILISITKNVDGIRSLRMYLYALLLLCFWCIAMHRCMQMFYFKFLEDLDSKLFPSPSPQLFLRTMVEGTGAKLCAYLLSQR